MAAALQPTLWQGESALSHLQITPRLPCGSQRAVRMGAKLFVSAVGVPPKYAVDKLHAAGIPVMNMTLGS